jgi:hypothetical protein
VNEKTEQYIRYAKTHVDRIVVGVMFALLCAMIWLWMREQTSTGEGASEPKVVNLTDSVAANPNYKVLTAMTSHADITSSPLIDQIRKYNMFDYKSVKQKEAIEREANAKFAQAKEAADRGQVEEAQRLLKDILASFPTHQKANDLSNRLNPKPVEKKPVEPAASGAGTAAVPGPPGPGAGPPGAPPPAR